MRSVEVRKEGDDGKWKAYNSLNDAANVTGVSGYLVGQVCKGFYRKGNSAKGWCFRYGEEKSTKLKLRRSTRSKAAQNGNPSSKTEPAGHPKRGKKRKRSVQKPAATASLRASPTKNKKGKTGKGKTKKHKDKNDTIGDDGTVRSFSGQDGESNKFIIEKPGSDPKAFVSWNANSIRLRAERTQIKAFANYCKAENIDVFCVQETRTKPCDWKKVELQMAKQGFKQNEWKYYWNHHPRKRYSGTMVAVRTHCLPKEIICGMHGLGKPTDYDVNSYPNPEEEGRVMIAEWEDFYMVNCYIPVSGFTEKKRERRMLWDIRFTSMVKGLNKPVIVLGDFNISRTDNDVSHPNFFTKKFKGLMHFPSFTIQERNDFEKMLESCKLSDTFRELHPSQKRITWGWNVKGFWSGKMMGLDYALVSESIRDRVVASDISRKPGYKLGAKKGCFMSDHCAIKLQLAGSTRPAKRRRVVGPVPTAANIAG